MRLFIAIILREEIKTILNQTVEKMQGYAKSGTFTERDNLHLTLSFIGETSRVEHIKQAMQQASRKQERIILC